MFSRGVANKEQDKAIEWKSISAVFKPDWGEY